MSQSNFFALMSRMKYITRWGLMKNTMTENIQEHSLSVAMYAHALAVISNDVCKMPVDPGMCAIAAIYHDAPEIITGDLPTPVKYFNPEIREAYKAVEESSEKRILNMLPDELRGSYEPIFAVMHDENSDVKKLVKAADRISAYVKCLEETKSGNREFAQAAVQIRQSIDKIEHPAVKYFMETFIPGFDLTLDELK